MKLWEKYASVVTARLSWLFLLLLLAVAGGVMGVVGDNDAAGQSPATLPDSSQSARAKQALSQFPDAGAGAAIVVLTRADGAELTEPDVAAAAATLDRAAKAGGDPGAPSPIIQSPDHKAAIGRVPVSADASGFELRDQIDRLRQASKDGLPAALTVQVTGGPAFGGDIADSFSGANTTLLAVTAVVVAVLLVITYRSPVLWLIPLLIIGTADRTATVVGTGLARLTGLTFDGSTSGITSVLVFGAGTNYALLLVSRYRDELHREADHRRALRRAVRRAGPAILASNLTVVAALLVLASAALPNTRSLGVLAAAGLVVALVFVLLGLPAALALCGRKVFWPFVPRPDGRDQATEGIWHATAVRAVRRPIPVIVAAIGVLAVFAGALFTVDVGLSQTERFRVRAESVDGFDTLAAHFPSGSADPTIVVARESAAASIDAALPTVPGVLRANKTGTAPTGLARWSVVLDAPPGSAAAFDAIDALRARVADIPEADALVGGGDAEALDTRVAAAHDRTMIMPLILAIVLVVLLVLLRALPAALLLVGVTALSAIAALGLGSWVSVHVFGFPAIDTNVPLYALLFLVALGVDYTIFLVTRAREETPAHGTADGIVRAVATTGAVITSAGVVLAAVFCVLGVLPLITLTQLGIVVALGILLDTFVVRTVIIPALFTLLGARIWWPSRLDETDRPRPSSDDRSTPVPAHQ
ncbi:RND superfamily putative drug exporter [Nocardia tenerifensis]|uniref:RND superfamily putative drug exporter n=1 Tax=Nocardia tenerifensis TaxID=228006 RepID=A0A318JUW0_9NOCA|nr:MMPL family transporter [Nocardia tenerifensis]PXX56335.1 RND superfamily putative drug exporter [Nocardia tenerifensis]